jgi:hypothetical protein
MKKINKTFRIHPANSFDSFEPVIVWFVFNDFL